LARKVLQLSNIDTYYGDSQALHNVTFDMEEGRVLSLLGRNGAGKTTTISSIVGFLAPRNGFIELFGEPVCGLAPEVIAHKGVGLVPQGRRIFPSLTVQENLTVAARKPGWQRVPEWALEHVYELFPRLQERLKQAAGTLSGGEQQMLAIARALMTNPRLLLLDEPSEGLAPMIVSEVTAAIAKLKASGLSIILVEHNTKLALDVADDVIILNTGTVAFEGSVQKARDEHKQVAQLLGVY